MAQCMCKMVIDVADRECTQVVVARQGDSATRCLRLRLSSYGELLRVEEGAVPVLNVRNESGEVRVFTGEVHADGSITLPMTSWMLKNQGVLECDIAIFDEKGGKLTTPPFEIDVLASIAPDDVLPGHDDEEENFVAELIAEEQVYNLNAYAENGEVFVYPSNRRRYQLNLSDGKFADEEGWRPFHITVPMHDNASKESWFIISCYAPLREGRGVPVVWSRMDKLNFVDGVVPTITQPYFDIVAVHEKGSARWNVGVVQYQPAEEQV